MVLVRDLQQLTNLRHLSAEVKADRRCNGSKLSALQQLTFLHLRGDFGDDGVALAPPCLADKTNLQHLLGLVALDNLRMTGGPAGDAALLHQLKQLQHLTHLTLRHCWWYADPWPGEIGDGQNPSAASLAALTTSSKLQQLDLSGISLPLNVWQHVFPAGALALALTLKVLRTPAQYRGCACADSMRLVDCCPDLQQRVLHARPWPLLPADALVPLSALSALRVLVAGELDDAGFAAVAQLTSLQELQ